MTNSTKVQLFVEHDGVAYKGQIGTIEATQLGFEDHGILTSYLHLNFGGSGQGAGGYSLDKSAGAEGNYKRIGTAYGLDYILRTLEVVGVSNWEDIKGNSIIALRDDDWGLIRGIADLTGKRVLIYKAHADAFAKDEV